MSRKTQPEKSKLVNRLSNFMDDGDVIILAKYNGKVYSNFVQIDKVPPATGMELVRLASTDLILWGGKVFNLIDSHDDNV
jgi:hypothetical protein